MVLLAGPACLGERVTTAPTAKRTATYTRATASIDAPPEPGANEFCQEASYVTRCLDRREHGQRQEPERGIMPQRRIGQ